MSPVSVAAARLTFDIVVTGGSLAAPAAALAAARANPKARILLTEPTDWLGGQATSQGVSAIDNAYHVPGGPLMADNPPLYYAADYLDFLQRIENAPPTAPGEGMAPRGSCWVSRESFDPRTAAWVLDEMIAAQPNIAVLKMAVVKAVATEPIRDEFGAGRRIVSVTLVERQPKGGYRPFDDFLSKELPDWYDSEPSARFDKTVYTVVACDAERGLVVIDASELADAVVLSARHTRWAARRPPKNWETTGRCRRWTKTAARQLCFRSA